MAHQITTFGERHYKHDRIPEVNSGDINTSPILTVCDGHNEVSLYFRPDLTKLPAQSPPGIIVNPWSEDLVTIEGEDLHALRSLLNELPEGAFVEPAPAIKEPKWRGGDVIEYLKDDLFVLYTRQTDGQWRRFSSVSGESAPGYDDDAMERRMGNVASLGIYTVRRKGGVNL